MKQTLNNKLWQKSVDLFERIVIRAAFMVIASIITVAPFASDSLQAATLEDIKSKGILSVAVYKNFSPFSKDKQGIDVRVAEKIAEKLGVSLKVLEFDADESMDDDLRNMVWKGTVLGYGPADLMMHVPVDPIFAQRNDKVKIFSGYFRDDIRVARDTSKIPNLNHIDVFEKETIGVEDASISSAILSSTQGGRITKNLRHYINIDEAFVDLAEGKISAVMALGSQAQSAMGHREGFAVSIPPLPGQLPPAGWAFGLAVKSNHADLAAAIEQAMSELADEGALDAVFAEFGVKRIKP